ncbi:MAG: hexitol phosphatase HxpB [Candidatus Paceibacterota bacterium]|jgi:sugar-phosphatase
MIKAVIFDMDGVLIDSEFLWRRATVKVFNNINISLTIDMCKATMGLRIDEVVDYWELKYPTKEIKKEKIVTDILQELISLIKTEGKIMEGVDYIIEFFTSRKIPMAIASSSPTNVINAVLKKILIKDKMLVIHSAENESHGKPHPSVYITTAEKLGISPSRCLAFEDSLNGVLSAKAAGMKCVAVPRHLSDKDETFNIADLIIMSLNHFTLENLKNLEN